MDPIAFSIGPFDVRWYAICILCGVVLAVLLAYAKCKKLKIDPDHLLNITLLCMIFGIIGARTYYVLFSWSYYSAHPDQIIAIWKGGLAIHGGIIAGLLVIFIYSRIKNHSFRRWLDILAPGVLLAQAVGR